MAAKKRGRPQYKPTKAQKDLVKAMAVAGTAQEQMLGILNAAGMNLSGPTLRKYFRHELDTGRAEAVMQVSQALLRKAVLKGGNVEAQKFFLRTRGGDAWRLKDELDLGGELQVQGVVVLPAKKEGD